MEIENVFSKSLKIVNNENIRGQYFLLEYDFKLNKELYYEWLYNTFLKKKFVDSAVYIFHINDKKTEVYIDSGSKDIEIKYNKNIKRFLYLESATIALEPIIYKYKHGSVLFMKNVKELMEIDKDYYTSSIYNHKNKIYPFTEEICSICENTFQCNIIFKNDSSLRNSLKCEDCIFEMKNTKRKKDKEELRDSEIDSLRDKFLNFSEYSESLKILKEENKALKEQLKLLNVQVIHLTQITNDYFNKNLTILNKEPLPKFNVKLFIVDLGDAETRVLKESSFCVIKEKRDKCIGINYNKYNIYFYGIIGDKIENETDLIQNIKKHHYLKDLDFSDLNPFYKTSFSKSIDFEINRIENFLKYVMNSKYYRVSCVNNPYHFFDENLLMLKNDEYILLKEML